MAATSPVARRNGSAVPLDASTIRRWVEQSCANQGLPVTVTDPGVLARIAILFRAPTCGPSPKAVA